MEISAILTLETNTPSGIHLPLQTAEKAPVVPYPQVPTGNELYISIIGELERFDLLHASPMDCMQFISSLKKQLINR